MSQLGQGAPWGFPVCPECETRGQNTVPGSSELLLLLSAVEILNPSFASGWSPPHSHSLWGVQLHPHKGRWFGTTPSAQPQTQPHPAPKTSS